MFPWLFFCFVSALAQDALFDENLTKRTPNEGDVQKCPKQISPYLPTAKLQDIFPPAPPMLVMRRPRLISVGRSDDDVCVDHYISEGELIHRSSSEPSVPGGISDLMLKGTSMTLRHCGERRPSMRSPLSRWSANFGDGAKKKRHKTRILGAS